MHVIPVFVFLLTLEPIFGVVQCPDDVSSLYSNGRGHFFEMGGGANLTRGSIQCQDIGMEIMRFASKDNVDSVAEFLGMY